MRLLKSLLYKLPLRNYIIFESNPDFSDNTYWLFKHMAEETDILKRYKCVWFITNVENTRAELCGIPIICVNSESNNVIDRIIRFYYTCFAKIIIDCNRFIYKRRPEQFRVYLTHGMPLKIPVSYFKGIGDCDLLPVTASKFKDVFANYVSRESIVEYGLPRNDIFRGSVVSFNKYILWMPTFRQHKTAVNNKISNIFPLGIPVIKSEEDIAYIDAVLKKYNIRLMIRPHPAQDLSVLKIGSLGNIIIADDKYLESIGESLYSFVAHSSALITDYSSIYYDYLFLGRPIGLTLEDADIYSKQWPLVIDNIKNDLPGNKLNEISDLKAFIEDIFYGVDREKEQRNKFIKKFGFKNTSACEMISKIIKEKVL